MGLFYMHPEIISSIKSAVLRDMIHVHKFTVICYHPFYWKRFDRTSMSSITSVLNLFHFLHLTPMGMQTQLSAM